MKRIKFNEIIECSCQKSILSGQAGFGIRTITEGFNPELARKICDEISCAYEVDITEQVTTEQITTDPACVTKYPRTLKYQVIKNDDGKELYVVACATYVGIDYGYFCDIETARRAGSNYIADILVFEEKPTSELFHTLLEQKTFLPKDNTSSPTNPELQQLLTGEPSYLSPREIEVKEVRDEHPAINEDTARIAIAFLQTKINKDLGKDAGLQNIVIQAQESKMPFIMESIGTLPNDLVSDKYFHTNYLQGYGMPNGYRMMLLNEHNKEQVYIENYVYLNLDEKEYKNVYTDNYYFGKIKEAASANNYDLYYALVNYLFQLSLQTDSDYKFLYNLFIATATDKKLGIEELTDDFFTMAKKANMPSDKLKRFIISVNNTLDETIKEENLGTKADANCHKAMKSISFLYNNWKEVLHLNENSLQRLTNLWHIDGTLARYANEFGIDVIQYINTKDNNPEAFIEAIKKVDNPDYWERFIKEQMKAFKENNVPHGITNYIIIDTILTSAVADKNSLIARFYPISSAEATLISYIESHPNQMESLEPTIKSLCKNNLALMIKFLNVCAFDGKGFLVMRPIVLDYFTGLFKESKEPEMKKAIEKLVELTSNVTTSNMLTSNEIKADKLKALDIPHYVKIYTDYSEKFPKVADKQSIDFLLKNDITKSKIEANDTNRLEFIVDLASNKTDYMGTYRELLIAKRLGCPMLEVRLKIVEKLFTDKAKKHEKLEAKHITEYFTDKYSEIPSEETKEESKLILDRLWDIFKSDPHICEEATPAIIKAAKWTSKERKKYLEKCKNEKEKAFITKYYSFVTSLIRKLFKKK